MPQVNPDSLDRTTIDEGDTRTERKQLGQAVGADGIECSLYELPPGGKFWPYHYRTANEEAMLVLARRGPLVDPDGRTALDDGGLAWFPASGAVAGLPTKRSLNSGISCSQPCENRTSLSTRRVGNSVYLRVPPGRPR